MSETRGGSPPASEVVVPKMMGLRVLLVDSDDSTRRLIAALLRKCSYKVVAISDGLKAWETLKARPQNIDLILAEVDLPSISGYALLTLIMEHDICKRIPVIMMSSEDSITLVLRCMLIGASDFLVKPIRRNELMNMWQHVWRRQSKTEGCAVQNTTGAKHKVDATCENKAGNDLSSSNVTGEDRRQEQSLQLIGKFALPTSEIGAKPSRSGPEVISLDETNKSTVSSLGEDTTCARLLTSDASDLEHDNISGDTYRCTHELVQPSGAIDYIGKFEDYSGNINGCSSAECGVDKLSFPPYLKLSLRRPCPNGVRDEGTIEDQRLDYSNASAFSWYDNRKTTMQSPSPAMGSNCGHDGVLSGSREDQVSQNGQAEAAVPGSQLGFIPLAVLSSDSTIWQNYIPPELHTSSGLSPTYSPSSDVLPLNRLLCSGSEDQDYRPTSSEKTVDNIGGDGNGVRDASPPVLEPSATSTSCSGATAVGKLKKISICGSLCSTVDKSNSGSFETVRKSSAPEGLNYSCTLVQVGMTGMDSHSPSQREAALQKFRLKRKDRCFDKKVRYQSRKRLAEQRPRVKGQFVREVKAEP